jgi:hypothetical protein
MGGVAVALPEVMEVVHGEEVEVGRRPARELLQDPARLDSPGHRSVDGVAPGPHRLGPGDLAALVDAAEVPVDVDVIEQAFVSVRLGRAELVAPLHR